MTDIAEYVAVGEATGSFRPVEIDILREVLESCSTAPGKDYSLVEERIGAALAGFAIYGRTPMTDFSWDVYWIAVDPRFQKKGIGARLIAAVEAATLREGARAVFRVETSGTEDYAYVRRFYEHVGYVLAGTIPDFYATGDDFCLYAKDIRREPC